jgi:hypothetical protein
MLKPFNQSTFDADDNAKHDAIHLFQELYNCDIRVNQDRYGIDLVGKYLDFDRELFGVEVEVKHNWQSEHFMFETVHYAARKTKFIDLYRDVFFVTVNSPRTHALVINIASLDTMKMVRKQTSETSSEWFLEIPTHLFYKYSL